MERRQRKHPPRRSRKHRARFTGFYRILGVIAVVAAVVVACIMFFRVGEITVVGNVRYGAQEIMEISGIESGDNLITIPKRRIESALHGQLPYVESVTVHRHLPDRVEIVIRECTAAATIESDTGTWLLSGDGKVLERTTGQSGMKITGLRAVDPNAGSPVQVAEEDRPTLDYVLDIMAAMSEKNLLWKATAMNCALPTSIEVDWDIYTIKFPRGGDYEYMVGLFFKAVNHEKMPKDTPGLFDLTIEEGEVHFKPEK